MQFDLAFVLIDIGDPWYKTAALEMIRSARRAYKDHDMRVVQLTDDKTAQCPEADGVFDLKTSVSKEQMCQAKGHLIAEYALKADRPVIFCDVDIIWNNGDALRHLTDWGVAGLWRNSMPSMPVNTGIIFSNTAADFWRHYRAACDNLPAEVCGWYGDQFAMLPAIMHDLAEASLHNSLPNFRRVWMDDIAPAIDELPDKPLTTPAVHFKGQRKHLMTQYARLLDGGAGFDFARPTPWRPQGGPYQVDLSELNPAALNALEQAGSLPSGLTYRESTGMGQPSARRVPAGWRA